MYGHSARDSIISYRAERCSLFRSRQIHFCIAITPFIRVLILSLFFPSLVAIAISENPTTLGAHPGDSSIVTSRTPAGEKEHGGKMFDTCDVTATTLSGRRHLEAVGASLFPSSSVPLRWFDRGDRIIIPYFSRFDRRDRIVALYYLRSDRRDRIVALILYDLIEEIESFVFLLKL